MCEPDTATSSGTYIPGLSVSTDSASLRTEGMDGDVIVIQDGLSLVPFVSAVDNLEEADLERPLILHSEDSTRITVQLEASGPSTLQLGPPQAAPLSFHIPG